MADFSLKSGNDTLDFDIKGNVTKSGASFGTWDVADDGQVRVTDTNGAVTTIPVIWQFNEGNQLEIHQAGTVVFNFHANAQLRPDFQVSKGVLLVAPDGNGDFSFSLHGDWDLDGQFNLIFTIASVKSTINGILRDTGASEFIYIFIAQQGPFARTYELDFTGKWQQNGSGMDVDFIYDKENNATGMITLPPGLSMDPVKNILVYTYNKGTHSGSLELAGSVRINSNFSVTYILDQQDQAGIQSTTFSIDARLKSETLGEGNLQLLVKRDGADLTLQIGGNYHGAVAGLDLTVGFNYQRIISGTTVQDSVAFNGKISNPGNGNAFTWSFQMKDENGQIKSFEADITAHIMLRPGTCIDAALTFSVNGQQVAIAAMFRISTNCAQAQAGSASSKALVLSPQSTARKTTMQRLQGWT